MELLRNLNFSDGFELHHVEKRVTNRPIAIFNLKNTAKRYPAWQLAQWCCKHNLADGTERVNQTGDYEISDESKRVTVDVEHGIISLELNTAQEYTVPRVEGEGWPHILLEQIFEKKVHIMHAKHIMLNMELSVDKVVCRQKQEVKKYHTAQFSWIFALADRSGGKGDGDFVWFGCPVYDFRYPFPGEFRAQDGGKPENTGKYIYFIDSKNYLTEPVAIGKRVKISVDVTKFMQDALSDAKAKGFLPNSDLSDIVLENTNLGWEVTGTFDVGLTFYSLSVDAEEMP